jgi:hypothetical protein
LARLISGCGIALTLSAADTDIDERGAKQAAANNDFARAFSALRRLL